MNVCIASDHAGFALKKELISFLEENDYSVKDFGAESFQEDDDYPDFITPCAESVASEAGSFGIVIGGSGQGEAMAANRIQGVRAVVYYGGPLEIPRLGREHNNANVLSLGARFVSVEQAKEAVTLFLNTSFSEDRRHVRRLGKF